MISIIILTLLKSTHNAPRTAWPYMKNYDIWDVAQTSQNTHNKKSIEFVENGDKSRSYFDENHVETSQQLGLFNNTNKQNDFNRNRNNGNGRKAKGKRCFI